MKHWLRSLLTVALLFSAACASPRSQAPVTAFVGVTLISAYGAPHLSNQTVLTRGDRIIAVGPASRVRAPRDALVLGRPGQVLAPGLVDMHVHIFEPNDGALFIANGVTTVRNMSARPDGAALTARIAAGEIPGPFIYTSSRILDGPHEGWNNARAVRTADEMRAYVNESADAGDVGVKLYEDLAPDVFAAGVYEARRRHVQVYAHVPFSMSLDDVLALRIDSIEHLTGFDRALSPNSTSASDEERWSEADMSLAPALARRVAESGVWNTATLVTGLDAPRAFADMATAEAEPNYRYATARLRQHWLTIAASIENPQAGWAMTQRAHANRLAMIAALHNAGAPLLIGTDATQPFVYPGFSLHRELELHLDAGLSPAEVLRADTDAARFLGRTGEFGVIAVDARADLLLLDGDPERDLELLRRPRGVMAAGRWYDAEALQGMLDDIVARVAAETTR